MLEPSKQHAPHPCCKMTLPEPTGTTWLHPRQGTTLWIMLASKHLRPSRSPTSAGRRRNSKLPVAKTASAEKRCRAPTHLARTFLQAAPAPRFTHTRGDRVAQSLQAAAVHGHSTSRPSMALSLSAQHTAALWWPLYMRMASPVDRSHRRAEQSDDAVTRYAASTENTQSHTHRWWPA